MRFRSTRKALDGVRGARLKSDLETVVSGIEKIARKNVQMAGARTDQLIGFVVSLRKALPQKVRFDIVGAILDDAIKGEVPHQWERKEGFECGRKFDCGKENPDKTCYRDTVTGACISG